MYIYLHSFSLSNCNSYIAMLMHHVANYDSSYRHHFFHTHYVFVYSFVLLFSFITP